MLAAVSPRRTPTVPTGGMLDPYLRELERLPVMDAEDEHAKADLIRSLRQAYWVTLLSFPPLLQDIVADVAAQLGPRAAELPAIGDESQASIEAVAAVLVDLDPRCDVADRLLADLETSATTTVGGLGRKVSRTSGSTEWLRSAERRRLALQTARREFAAANLRLVFAVARRYRHNGFIGFADLVQEGNVGLMLAVDRFDPRRGFRFSTYAAWWIKHAITRALSKHGRTVRIPTHVLATHSRLRRLRDAFEREHRRLPSDGELAEIASVGHEKIALLGRLLLRTETLVGETDSVDALDSLCGPASDPVETIDADARAEILRRGFHDLNAMENEILRLRYGLGDEKPMTLREIGELYSLSRERIRQLQNRALGKLRAVFAREGFDEAATVSSTASAAQRAPMATIGTPAPG
jgi:RNA polymerase primary sigma factor